MTVLNALTLSLVGLWYEISLKGCSWLELPSPWAAGQPVLAAPAWWHPELRWGWALCLLAVPRYYLAGDWGNKKNKTTTKRERPWLLLPAASLALASTFLSLTATCCWLCWARCCLALCRGKAPSQRGPAGPWQLMSPCVGLGEQAAPAPAPGGADQCVRCKPLQIFLCLLSSTEAYLLLCVYWGLGHKCKFL